MFPDALNRCAVATSQSSGFRLSHEDNLKVMAQWLFMGAMDPDEIKHELYSTKVMEYREEMKEIVTMSKSSSHGGGRQTGIASGAGDGGTLVFSGDDVSGDPLSTSMSDSHFQSTSESESESWSESESESTS